MTESPFFEPPNRVRPGNGTADARLASRASLGAVLAAYPWDDGESVRWYVACDRATAEQVREEVLAHVGVSFTDYRGQRTVLDPADEGDRRAQEVEGGREVVRVTLASTAARNSVSAALGRMMDLWSIRPTAQAIRRRPAAELLAEYRLALQAGHREDAERALSEMRTGGTLDVANIHFLELELLSVCDGPAAVLEHPRLESLLLIRRPARVSDILARAVDQLHLRVDATLAPQVLRRRFDELPPGFQGLITAPGECRSAAGALLLALRYDSAGRSPRAILEQLPSVVDLDAGTEDLINGLTELRPESFDGVGLSTALAGEREVRQRPKPGTAPPLTATDVRPPESAADLLSRGDYDQVLEIAASTPEITFELLDAALRAAQWLDSIESARQALAVLDRAPEDVRDRFTANRLIAPLVGALRDLVVTEAPRPRVTNWVDFFQNLEREPNWSAAVETAEHGVLEWSVAATVNDPVAIRALAAQVAAMDSAHAACFPQIVPLLIEWLGRAPDSAQHALLDVHEALLAYLSLEDETRSGLTLLGEFAINLIESGLSTERYEFCLDNLEERWSVSQSPATVGWIAEILECLIDQPCPSTTRRDRFASTVIADVGRILHRIDDSLGDIVRALAGELGLADLLPEVQVKADAADRPQTIDASGVVIGLYSLTPGALQRAKAALEKRWQGLTVKTRSDKDASAELASLARNADAMIVAWKSSKHAATDCIEASRSSLRPAAMAEGKGSASLIRTAEVYLNSLQHDF